MNAPLATFLAETKARLQAICGDRLQRIVLFGARAATQRPIRTLIY